MATSLAQMIEVEAAKEAAIEAQRMAQALLLDPPKGTVPYMLTRGFYDSGMNYFPKDTVLFFEEGQAPTSAKRIERPEVTAHEGVAQPSILGFEERKEAEPRVNVEVSVNGEKASLTTAQPAAGTGDDDDLPVAAAKATVKK